MKKNTIIQIVVLVLVHIVGLHAQKFIHMNAESGKLPEPFQNAFSQHDELENFWIGYSIELTNNNGVSVGSFYFNGDTEVSLRDLIENSPKLKNLNTPPNHHRMFRIVNGRIKGDLKIDNETAILFRYDRTSKDIGDFAEIAICNLARYADLENMPLVWLGRFKQPISFEFIAGLFKGSEFKFAKEELLPGIGIHADLQETTEFLAGIYKSDESYELREDALFWLGQQDNYTAFEILKQAVSDAPSEDLKEKAVMGIGQLDLPEALDELIVIARKNRNMELRQEAIMWLGHKAVKKAEDELKGFVENDPDIEIKKRALFALANQSDNNVDFLINLAMSNRSLQIRKHAIWALGSTDNPRAVEALINLAKGAK